MFVITVVGVISVLSRLRKAVQSAIGVNPNIVRKIQYLGWLDKDGALEGSFRLNVCLRIIT